MAGKFLKYFYFFSKLTTTLVLFILIVFLGYIFIKAYQTNNDKGYELIISDKINELSAVVKSNSDNLNFIDEKITNYETALNQISQTLNEKIVETELDKLPDKFNELLKENKKLHKELKSLNYVIKDSKKMLDNIDSSKKQKNTPSNLIRLIELKYENGFDTGEELLLLQKQIIDDSKNAYLEKLFVLSDKKFIGIVNLQNEFEKLMKDYLNVHYLKNNNLFFKYLSRFYSIEPNTKSNFKNNILENFSIAKNKLYQKDIKSSLKYLLLIEDSNIYFQKWIKEAENYVNFKNNLRSLYNS